MNLSKLILRIAGWRVDITVPDYPKSIICVAPHTSNWDFILGKLAYASIGRKAGFLMKESWFFFPLGCFFKAIGGIPVPRQKGSSLTDKIVERFRHSDRLTIAITPEGTRRRTDNWRRGFLYIAYEAKVPILLGAIDYGKKEITISREFTTTGDVDADLSSIKRYYRDFTALYPEKFSTD
ncbi:MAG: 1-acyl-sn-glycerol-3-phosphate acyltransferase [Pseudoflavonifractor sp.]|nr:1-acyl-sn-glycerol-3-phosphate acyltransferase [Pseudoflavonifractor sp.]